MLDLDSEDGRSAGLGERRMTSGNMWPDGEARTAEDEGGGE